MGPGKKKSGTTQSLKRAIYQVIVRPVAEGITSFLVTSYLFVEKKGIEFKKRKKKFVVPLKETVINKAVSK